ncbi:MAG: HEPN domain-containing protein [Bacteroidetes bacterium]|nr:HEPN domain-containing protein [Bacteroidota bacterium]
MKTINFHAILPIRHNSFTEIENENYLFCLNNFLDNLSILLTHIAYNLKLIKVERIDLTSKTEELFNLLNIQRLGSAYLYDFFNIEIEYNFDEIELIKANPNLKITPDELDLEPIGAGALVISLAVQDSLILSSIAFPGQLHSAIGRVNTDEHILNTIDEVDGFANNVFYDKIYGNWPVLKFLDIQKVIKWEKKLGLFSQGVGANPVQKAFSSYTHILKQTTVDTFEMLFWTMQGLEGFYCNGKGELRNQLSEKSKIFLGNWEDTKNIVGHLYDLRSKFVHGGFPLTGGIMILL